MKQAAQIAIVAVAAIVGLGASLLGVYFIGGPALKLFAGFEGFWGPLACLMVGGWLLALINIPFTRVRDTWFCVNAFGFFVPIAAIVTIGREIGPAFVWHYAIVWLAAVGLYFVFSRISERGVVLPASLLVAVSLAFVSYLHWVAKLPLREIMWWGFTGQYTALLPADITKAFAIRGAKRVSIGGAGGADALWSGPVGAVSLAYLMQRVWWGG